MLQFENAEEEEEFLDIIWDRLTKSVNRQVFSAIFLILLWYVRFLLCANLTYFEITDLEACLLLALNALIQAGIREFSTTGKRILAILYAVWLCSLYFCLTFCLLAFVRFLQFYSCEFSKDHGKCSLNVNTKGAFYLSNDLCTSMAEVVPFSESSKYVAVLRSIVLTMLTLAYATFTAADFKLLAEIGKLVLIRTILARHSHDDNGERPKGFVNKCFDRDEGTGGSGSDDSGDESSAHDDSDDDRVPSYHSVVEKGDEKEKFSV